MEFLMKVWEWMSIGNGLIIVVAILAVSECLALIPVVKANSVYQAIYNGLGWLKEKFTKK